MKYSILIVLIATFLSGCVRNNPKPIWLEINQWTLNSNPLSVTSPGDLTHNITDVWVYIDNKVIGVFEVPCKIPVLVSGNLKVALYPAIRNNGISVTKKIYPFYEPFETSIDFVSGETYTVNPTTQYYSTCRFWLEDFAGNTIKVQTDQTFSNAALAVENDQSIALTGKYGHIALTTADSLWYGRTTDETVLPKGGKEVYLEIDYRNTNSLLTGVLAIDAGAGTSTGNPNIALNAQSASTLRWKKIYIDLHEIVSASTNATSFKQYFQTLLPTGMSSGDVYIDNIRLVYF